MSLLRFLCLLLPILSRLINVYRFVEVNDKESLFRILWMSMFNLAFSLLKVIIAQSTMILQNNNSKTKLKISHNSQGFFVFFESYFFKSKLPLFSAKQNSDGWLFNELILSSSFCRGYDTLRYVFICFSNNISPYYISSRSIIFLIYQISMIL